jgi:uncharacterized protein involved in response to NO
MVKRGLKDHLPWRPSRFEMARIGVTAAGLLSWLLAPSADVTGWLLALARLLQLTRMVRWSEWRALADPLVAILHKCQLTLQLQSGRSIA